MSSNPAPSHASRRSRPALAARCILSVAAIAAVAVLGLAAGCQVTERTEDGYEVDFTSAAGKQSSILDAQIKALEEKAALYPKRADLQYRLAGVYSQAEKYHETVAHLKNAIAIDGSNVRYHYDLGRVLFQMKETDAAAKSFKKAIDVAGGKRWSGLFSAYGYTLCYLDRWEEARAAFESAVATDAKDPTPYYFLGSIADLQGRPDDAIRDMREYLDRGGAAFRRRAIEILGFHGILYEDPAAAVVDAGGALEGATAPVPSSAPAVDGGVSAPDAEARGLLPAAPIELDEAPPGR